MELDIHTTDLPDEVDVAVKEIVAEEHLVDVSVDEIFEGCYGLTGSTQDGKTVSYLLY